MNIRSLFMVFIFAGMITMLAGTIGNSVAQLNLISITAPTLDNLTGSADDNDSASNSTSTSDNEESEESEEDKDD